MEAQSVIVENKVVFEDAGMNTSVNVATAPITGEGLYGARSHVGRTEAAGAGPHVLSGFAS